MLVGGLALTFAAAVAWCLWRAVRQWRRYETLAPTPSDEDAELPSLAVIVPARNEVDTIEASLDGLRRQDYPRERLRIIVVDDDSTDGTTELIRRAAARDPHIQLLAAGPLPEGWAGKPHACWRGARAARAEWLCFLDADTQAAPALLRTAVDAARARGIDMLSLEPFQALTGFLDRLIIPIGFLALAASQDIAAVNAADRSAATANGQFILMRRDRYFAVGGHAAVHDAICEDSALARRVKAADLRLALLGAENLICTRMYRSARDLWHGLSKNATETFGGSARTLTVAAGALVIGWATVALPLWSAIAAQADRSAAACVALVLALGAATSVLATEAALLYRLRVPLWYTLLLPLSCTLAAVLALNAVLWRLRGRVLWKGRVYRNEAGIAAAIGGKRALDRAQATRRK